MYQKTGEAVDQCRAGKGAILLEARTYRFLGHFVGDPQNYRTKEEVEEWKKRDPIQMFRARVIAEGKLTAAELDAVDAQIKGDMEAALDSPGRARSPTSRWPCRTSLRNDGKRSLSAISPQLCPESLVLTADR